MTEKINVLGIEMDCLTAKEVMLRVMQFMEDDLVDTIELMSMDTLMSGRDDEEWKKLAGELEIVLPGEADILKAAEITDRVRLKEAENGTFFRLLMKYLQKNRKRVFLLSGTGGDLAALESVVRKYGRGIRVAGSGVLEQDGSGEEKVINDINGTESDCVLSVLQSPYQEQFIDRSRTLLCTKVWLGCGPALETVGGSGGTLQKLRKFFQKRMFFRQAEREKNQTEIHGGADTQSFCEQCTEFKI